MIKSEIFRCIKCHKKRAAAVRYVNPALSSSDTQNPLIDERVTIVLEEIDHNNVTPQDETPEVVVEYSNLKSYRVSLDQFIREVDNKREKDGFREEFKVLNADQLFLFYTYNEYLYFR